MPKRITKLTESQKARFDEWADKWIEVGLRTGDADRSKFEAAVRECYRFAGLEPPKVIVWVPSPLVVAIAGPVASYVLAVREQRQRGAAVDGAVDDAVDGAVRGAVDGAVRGAVRDAVRGAVDGAVRGAVRDAVRGAVGGAVDGAVRGAVGGAVRDAVRGAVGGAVDGAVRDAVRDAVDGAVRDAVRDAVRGAVDGAVRGAVDGAVDGAVRDAVDGAVGGAVGDAVGGAVRGAVDGAVRDAVRDAVDGAVRGAVGKVIANSYYRIMGGQFWVSGWWWGCAFTSYFRDVCGLELEGDLWDRGRAYEATAEAACWWWPHRDFVIVSERPLMINRELVDPGHARGVNSHRLHCEDGPAIGFRDGWGVWAWHGTRVTRQIIEAPETLTIAQIAAEENAEVRRVMVERIGWERFCSEAKMKLIHVDELRTSFPDIPVSEQVDAGSRLVTHYRDGVERAELLEAAELRDFEDRPLRFVRLTDPSTGRMYTIRVRHDHARCYEAVAWTFGLEETDYKRGRYLRQGDVFLKPMTGGPLRQQHS